MNIRHLRDYSPGYQLLRLYVNSFYRIFYRRLYIGGKENIPSDAPVIFAPNHQNALMDALAVVCNIKRQPVFLARSDIFKNPIAAIALRFLRILPVFRMRDGFNTLKENDEVFDEVTRLLQRKGVIGIMPEGNHGDLKRLRQLKKGIFRIAFQAEEKANFNLNLKIVPVGLEFSNYQSFRSDLYIYFGKPIDFQHLFDVYRENPQLAMNQAREYLSENMRLYMIDVRDETVHSLFLDLWKLAGARLESRFMESKNKVLRHYQGGKALSEALNQAAPDNPRLNDDLGTSMSELTSHCKSLNLPLSVLRKPPCRTPSLMLLALGLCLLFPVWMYGLINNAIPWLIIRKAVKSIKDDQFISTFKFVLGLVLFSLFYLIQVVLVGLIAGWLIALPYLVSLPISGFVCWGYLKWWKRLRIQWRYSRLKQKGLLQELYGLRDKLTGKIEDLVQAYPWTP
jgi:1-acyl-sn-glycerol-3-phosphate acyltransferase